MESTPKKTWSNHQLIGLKLSGKEENKLLEDRQTPFLDEITNMTSDHIDEIEKQFSK